ncbi:MAG: clan AA aspartic protease [Planctomycetia bacterium]|nr:clan AA aspartic protease [Planctomycetia bacterium]
MNGRVDSAGRALVRIAVKPSSQSPPADLDAWIDTGFTGELVLPQSVVTSLGLTQSGTVSAQLGDGSAVLMSTYTCVIEWFGGELQIEVVANDGQYALLGVGLLRDHKLTVDYPSQSLTIQ